MDGKEALDFGASSDFPSLLRRQGLLGPAAQIGPMNKRPEITPTESTTILAFKFSDGVLVAGDRRATSGNTVVYDRADKVLEIAGGAGNFVLRKYLGQKAAAKNRPG